MDAYEANRQLILKERFARDAKVWDVFRSSFASDAQVWVSWYKGEALGFVERSIQLGRAAGPIIAHELQPPSIWLNHDGTRGLVILGASIGSRSMLLDDAGNQVEVDITSHSRIYYTTSLQNGGWKISSLTCVYIKDSMTPSIPGQVLVIEPSSLARFRPSYRLLAWGLSQRGHVIANDLPGVDRPETIEQLHAEVCRWIGDPTALS